MPKKPGIEPMIIRGRAMSGYLVVPAEGLTDKVSGDWIAMTREHVSTLPKKPKK